MAVFRALLSGQKDRRRRLYDEDSWRLSSGEPRLKSRWRIPKLYSILEKDLRAVKLTEIHIMLENFQKLSAAGSSLTHRISTISWKKLRK